MFKFFLIIRHQIEIELVYLLFCFQSNAFHHRYQCALNSLKGLVQECKNVKNDQSNMVYKRCRETEKHMDRDRSIKILKDKTNVLNLVQNKL